MLWLFRCFLHFHGIVLRIPLNITQGTENRELVDEYSSVSYLYWCGISVCNGLRTAYPQRLSENTLSCELLS